MKLNPNDIMCQLIYDVENIRAEKSCIESKINGYTMYEFFHLMSDCCSMAEVNIKSELIGIHLEGKIIELLENFIKKDNNMKEYELAVLKIRCGHFIPSKINTEMIFIKNF